MTILAAQNMFRDGLIAMVDGRHEDACDLFKTAMTLEKARGTRNQYIRCMSYYGLTLALSHRAVQAGLHLCQKAARIDPSDPDLRLNYGRVLARTGRRTRALAQFEAGLKISPSHKALKIERAKLDRRARPIVPFLSRCHPLNQALGRLRASLRSGVTSLQPRKTDDSAAAL